MIHIEGFDEPGARRLLNGSVGFFVKGVFAISENTVEVFPFQWLRGDKIHIAPYGRSNIDAHLFPIRSRAWVQVNKISEDHIVDFLVADGWRPSTGRRKNMWTTLTAPAIFIVRRAP